MSEAQTGTLAEALRYGRKIKGLTLKQLSDLSGVSASHVARIERGERFPSARILRKLAKPLGFSETELFTLARYLPQPSAAVETKTERLDPYVAGVLALEPVEVQRVVITILSILKSMARAYIGEEGGKE